ncbi:MAG TPA: HDOD domain-containing protein [Candidatus Cloacimonadota bacterium]|nr:HDOD domain-containing protein [Candidatus Cloacimonadota bacterium]HQB40144.1 HDOD domain-containing protein [Candidatus Cloacimonadota bacterium]
MEFYKIELEKLDYLPTMPSVLKKLLEILNDNSVSNKEIAKIVSLDSSISAKILSIANSAIFGGYSPINDLNLAITRLGRVDVKTIAMTLFISTMLKKFKLKNIVIEHFWRHNLAVSFIARRIAQYLKKDVEFSEEERVVLYLTGLFHDIGYILFDQVNPDIMLLVKNQAIEQKEPFIELERIIIHTTHAHEGAELLKYWNLPKEITDTVRYHHEPYAATDKSIQKCAKIINMADYLANLFDISTLKEVRYGVAFENLWNEFEFSSYNKEEFTEFKNELASQTNLFISFSELALNI